MTEIMQYIGRFAAWMLAILAVVVAYASWLWFCKEYVRPLVDGAGFLEPVVMMSGAFLPAFLVLAAILAAKAR